MHEARDKSVERPGLMKPHRAFTDGRVVVCHFVKQQWDSDQRGGVHREGALPCAVGRRDCGYQEDGGPDPSPGMAPAVTSRHLCRRCGSRGASTRTAWQTRSTVRWTGACLYKPGDGRLFRGATQSHSLHQHPRGRRLQLVR